MVRLCSHSLLLWHLHDVDAVEELHPVLIWYSFLSDSFVTASQALVLRENSGIAIVEIDVYSWS